MMSDVAVPRARDRRRLVSAWAAGLSAFIAIAPTALILGLEIRSEFDDGVPEPGEVVTMGFFILVLGAITFALSRSALRSTPHPELHLGAAAGGLIALGLITTWFGGIYAVAAGLSIVAWIAGRTTGGASITAQLAVALASAAAVVVLYVGENALSAAVTN
jgi:hypothetical protein